MHHATSAQVQKCWNLKNSCKLFPRNGLIIYAARIVDTSDTSILTVEDDSSHELSIKYDLR